MAFSTVSRMFNQVTLNHGDRELYHYKDNNSWVGISGQEIREIVKNLSFALKSIGIGKGDCVSLLSTNSPRWSMSDYGIICSGAATVGIYPTLISSQIEYIINDSNSKVVLVENQDQLSKINEIWDNCSQLSYVIVMDDSVDSTVDKILNFSTFIEKGVDFDSNSEEGFENLTNVANPDDLLTLI